MIAVLSATEHDFYAMPLPFAVYSWNKLGFACIVFIPNGGNPKIELAKRYCNNTTFLKFRCEEKRIPTYSQVSRLFGATYNGDHNLTLITGDSDMCVFTDYFNNLCDGQIHIVGADLTPKDQYPMCYCAMPAWRWREVFNITKSAQEHTSELIDPIEGQNIRGEQWSYDQWYLKKKLDEYEGVIRLHYRAKPGTQFADKRADRDGWHFDPYNIIDAHLPRPLTNENNFNKVYELFKIKYPGDDLEWMKQYFNEYKKLL
ncbi:MAG TPA: hypothetical protein PKO16_06165 [Bacteroidia bacterium]|mgnify:CR=1 FL=1|jgi:hypothetical protein|nr:hypothetical protein [Bacteroidia bacterium]